MGQWGAPVSLDTSSLKNFTAKLRELPLVLAQKVATAAAPAITAAALETFDAGENPYGNTWEPGKDGDRITLHKSGALERGVRYVAIGTKLRVALGVKYARYQIGKRPVFPRQGADLPAAYVAALKLATEETIAAELRAK